MVTCASFSKTAADVIAFPLINIVNKCISFGIFPNKLEIPVPNILCLVTYLFSYYEKAIIALYELA